MCHVALASIYPELSLHLYHTLRLFLLLLHGSPPMAPLLAWRTQDCLPLQLFEKEVGIISIVGGRVFSVLSENQNAEYLLSYQSMPQIRKYTFEHTV